MPHTMLPPRPSRLAPLAAALLLAAATGVSASVLAPTQEWLPGECIPQFSAKLPVFGPGPNADLPRVNALMHRNLTVKMKETSRQVLPLSGAYVNTFGTGAACPQVNNQPTKIWAYETSDTLTGQLLGPAFWPAVSVDARRGVPTRVTYVNELPNGPGSLQDLISVDPTIHWADPLNSPLMNPCLENAAGPGCSTPYRGSAPTAPHLHGGEIPSQFDGGPQSWFTRDGSKGPDYFSLGTPATGSAVYRYNNTQQPGTLWFHDHALGVTRTNVYSGLAAFYLLRDPLSEPRKLPAGAYEIEMAIQDRQFDSNSQLFFPDGSGDPASNLNGIPANPAEHPFWTPEFIGDVIVVNGTPWPYLSVEPRRYRFRILNGSNSRFYNLAFGRPADTLPANVPVYAIGADDAYLDRPAGPMASLLLAPGERTDVIIDFTALAGKNVTVTNNARVPYPDGPAVPLPPGHSDLLPGDLPQPQMAQVMQFRVAATATSTDASCNPATGGCGRPQPMVRLTDGNGSTAGTTRIDRKRQLVLKEHIGFDTNTVPPTETGPMEVLLNNTKFNGMMSPANAAAFPTDGVSELPRVGSTELWEIVNLTADAHPIHIHLTQFQILNRQDFNASEVNGYPVAWAAAFGSPLPQACNGIDPLNPCPGYGPPLAYATPNADGAVGGNPAIGPYLTGNSRPPSPEESGWKDTARIMPGEVLRLLVRWTPTSTPATMSRAGRNSYSFDPTTGPGYVWHCHIIDHEDNEMMRPYKVTK